MSGKVRMRGIVWVLVGLAILLAGYLIGRPFVIRGTSLPFWPLIVAIGVIYLIYDAVKARRAERQEGDPTAPRT